MTQEEKAKAYDEAIDKVACFIKKHIGFGCTIHPNSSEAKELFNIFPELRESEDEQHRKWIIEYLHDGLRKSDEQFKDQFKAAIAWLEKQGESSIYNTPSREVILSIWDLGNEWKELTNGSISTEYGTQLDYIQKHWQESEYYLRAKQDEQKSVDKVEPKFHEDDWVVYNNDICQIVKREEGCNKLVTVFGIEKELVNERNLSTARPWTIQNAKDGDVLSDGTTIFIFKDLLSDDSVMSYCDYDTNSDESDAFCPLSMNLVCSKIIPATKEQRDTLMEAMKDAGYTFDFEKKELKKIKQKSAEWSEEDEDIFKHLLDEIVCLGNNRNSANRLYYDRLIKFIKELKNRAQLKEKWCDKDERMLDRLIAYFEKQVAFTEDDNPRYANWLKSLRPHKQWKPSDEQIKALHDFLTEGISYAGQGQLLIELYNNLKELTE